MEDDKTANSWHFLFACKLDRKDINNAVCQLNITLELYIEYLCINENQCRVI